MPPDLIASIAPLMLGLIRERLASALAAADTASAHLRSGDSSNAIEAALDIEVHTYEANVLLNALSLMNRVAREAGDA